MFRMVVFSAALALTTTSFAQASPAPRALTSSQVEALLGGEVIAEVERDGNNNRAELVCVIHAAPDVVWDVIMDYGAYSSWFPDQLASEVRQSDGNTHVLYGETRVPVLRNRTYELREVSETRSVDGQTHYLNRWEYVPDSGNLESSTGFWYVHPLDDSGETSVVRMVVEADLGMWLPQALINWGTRRMLPGIAEGIQQQANAR